MTKSYLSSNLHILCEVAILLLLTGCGYNFNDCGQSLGTNDSWSLALGANSSQSIALGDLNGDGILSMLVANQNQGNRVYNYEKEEFDISNNSIDNYFK